MPRPPGGDFVLRSADGPLDTRGLRGRVLLVYFGYVNCPDVCPVSIAAGAGALNALSPAERERTRMIMISVDPERDTPELLKAYMANFDPSFVALRTTPDKLNALAKDYKIYFKKVEGKTPTSYSMDHSAGSYVYDPAGRLRIYNRYGSGAQALAADVKVLLAEAGG